MKMNNFKVIIDNDGGFDDMLAVTIALKSKIFDVLGLTVVAGNQHISQNLLNNLVTCQYLDTNVEIYKGAYSPLKRERINAKFKQINCQNFLHSNNVDKLYNDDAINFIYNTLTNEVEKVTIVALGPLTNLAKVLKKSPLIVDKIKEIVIMGGALNDGNITKFAEFNIFADPDAAKIVFKSGCKVKLITLDVTNTFTLTNNELSEINSLNNISSSYFNMLCEQASINHSNHLNEISAPLHDLLTVLYLLENDVVTFKSCDIGVNCNKNDEKYGQTTFQANTFSNSYVSTCFNKELAYSLIFDTLKNSK